MGDELVPESADIAETEATVRAGWLAVGATVALIPATNAAAWATVWLSVYSKSVSPWLPWWAWLGLVALAVSRWGIAANEGVVAAARVGLDDDRSLPIVRLADAMLVGSVAMALLTVLSLCLGLAIAAWAPYRIGEPAIVTALATTPTAAAVAISLGLARRNTLSIAAAAVAAATIGVSIAALCASPCLFVGY